MQQGYSVQLTLTRLGYFDEGVIGELVVGAIAFPTMERPWAGNEHEVSCIPCGEYTLEHFNSPTKGDVLLLGGVPQRSMIEIHAANLVEELKGCIAVGKSWSRPREWFHLNDSVAALKAILAQLPRDGGHSIRIKNVSAGILAA